MNLLLKLNMQLQGLLYSPMRRRRIVPVTTSTARMMRLSSFTYITTIVLLVTFNFSFSQVHASAVKGGRCPEPRMDTRLCGGQIDQCKSDEDCSGESLCCTTGCNRVCILPSYTACEQVVNYAERRARALMPEDAKLVRIPECESETGKFKQVQCNGETGCYCVDSQGFEVPGTRAKSLAAVNCTNPKGCDGPMCRMLCPHGFELDEQGCEMCECKNVCKGVKCPSETTCEVEDAPCSTEPCPPVPSCKQPRSLESLCPFGAPLIIPESRNPFLCGTGPGQPTCPTAFECNVQTGNEYGVCCASNNNFDKPGSCPVVATTKDSSIVDANTDDCTSSCRHDLDCPELNKCCMTQGCGKQCSKPANSTACRQQKHIAELMSQKELEGKGYIPQCDENGSFIPKQCSRNGKVCWCVGPDGKNYPQSIGPSESVNCTNTQKRQRAALRSDDSYGCDKVICSTTCEFGFKTDRTGCPTCDCMESPCDSFFDCPTGSKCQMVSDPSCLKDRCTPKPTCLSDNLFVNPCALGTPLTDMESGQVVACSESATTCPSTHICVIVSPNKAGLCCANRPRVEPTKPGMCPLLSSALCNTNTTLGLSPKKCFSDNDCENSMKCCGAGDCTVCADPLLQQDLNQSNNSPTMCQYLRDAEEKVGGVFNKFRLAISKPQCKDNGEFNEIQCDEANCMCIDEHGAEIPGTMMERTHHNLTVHECIKARSNPKCLEMNCRLACDYGYETLDGCRICECRNPCMSKNGCGEDEQCEIVDIDCSDGQCPPLPFCIPKVVAPSGKELSFSCPKGAAFVTESNETLTCNPRARMLQCPDDYFCHDVIQSNNELGFCCPVLSEDEASQFLLSEDRKGSPSDMGGLLEGIFGSNAVQTKIGQCPYLIPFSSGSCESECESDYHCPMSKKCCLNSCGGAQCTDPLLLTACQHQKSILEHKARENGIPAKRVFIPGCDETGEYVRIQSFGNFRWCVDSAGHEIQGTRVPASEVPNCQKPAQCPQTTCSLQCEFGLQLDSKGCSICQCKPSPCDDVNCERTGEECRMMQLNCISEPCPPVPLCLPKLDNPCAFGSPLTFEETGDRVPCGPGFGSCPSSHRCNLSPFGEYAACCPKPKEVCFEKRDPGNCKAVAGITKWFFNSSSNECQPFYYSGCGGNSNLFNSKAECLSVCPALTHCERIREKNLELVNKYKHLSYIPKCDPRQGEWESMQCFEEVGMCWCVNKKGEPIKGTMTNGIPNCQSRRGRLLGASSTIIPTVCEPGVAVHMCNKTLCENKVCLGHPTAKCMINPCGGCNVKWISADDGQVLDCDSGLSKCHREMQSVMNSRAWINQGYSTAAADKDELEESAETPSSSTLGNTIQQLILNAENMSPFAGNGQRDPTSPVVASRMSTKVTPIFADFGGHKVMGIMSSTVTIMGGDHSGSSSSEEDESSNEDDRLPMNQRGVTPVKSIADILADMMTSQSQHTGGRSSRTYNGFDDFIDLMPSSSQVYPIPMRGMVPPPPIIPEFAFSRSDMPVSRVRRGVSSEEIPDSMAVESSSYHQRVPAPNREILMSIIPRRKSGDCPKPSHFALFNLLTGACSDECRYDSECNSDLKCCLSKCGMKCVEPESLDVTIVEVIPTEDVSSSILTQSYEEVEPATMLVSLPQCDAESGDYSPVQSQGDLSWCVTPDGQPIPETFTKGKVSCSSNGTILERYVRGRVCPDSEQTPMICQDQCMQASCPLHPEAICVMDVCNGCKPSFYNPSGEKVRCEEKCQQRPAEPGLCRASILRYSYHSESNKCDEFIYGGCQGNDNNFETLSECQSECEKTEIDVCSLPMKPGPCRASMPRWHFNMNTQSCEEFDYGGCGGNENNFMSKEHCETRCPDVILCPNIVDGEMKSCSRLSACKNVSCPNQPLEDFVCSVDACSCQAVLRDFNGNEVRCEDLVDSSTYPIDTSDLMSKVVEVENQPSSSGMIIEASPFEVLRVHTDSLHMRNTKCLSMSNQGVPISCDGFGQFSPLQCIPSEGPSTRTCFCVDEAGNQPDGSEPFPEGLKSCQKMTIEKVEVTLSFPVSMSGWDDKGVQLGTEVQDLLRSFNARLEEGKVESGVMPGSTIVRFTLIGDNKIDIAYFLETMVKSSAIGVENEGRVIAADYSTSKFTYVLPSDSSSVMDETTPSFEVNEVSVDEEKTKESTADDDDAVSAESLSVENNQSTLAILLTLVAAISCGLVVFGMFLAFQKKKSTGCYPKKPFETLAFNSQLYEFEKKAPKGSPTFTATPFVNQYKVTEDKPSSKA